ncbi:hypothetical protein J3R30DRAFT_3836380 [Lentinula aciculospora]|uniref:RRM domain-containing protein n=1 Tax=Lentinula aciculospora TaxID=153920 RepID=A0A9W9DI03_9AGAR|nr:hypothetical protein J3R30DRAFT_3527180 [Lentinula aciculospora]KAJ4483620.1 hypothetical protein J3R30DRAFT_3836380 [Lentinula aciculospora]
MASLLERMNVSNPGTGPVRSTKMASKTNTPYARAPRGDVESAWSHDLFAQHNSLSARMNLPASKPTLPPDVANASKSLAQRAFRDALSLSSPSTSRGPRGGEELNIKGAGSSGNVVEVSGLVDGTTADDVSAIFKRCGEISQSKLVSKRNEEVRIRITFKTTTSAAEAVKSFNGVPADGKTLAVTIVGATSAGTSLLGRFGKDGLGLVRQEGSVDILMDLDTPSGSKMRSDALTSDPRAQIMIAPPGADPKDYIQAPARGRGNRGRGRGGRRGGGGGRGRDRDRMDMN